MTSEFCPFFIETYPLEELQARWKIVTELCTYVVEGCRDQYDPRAEVPHGEEFKNVVKAIMGEHFARLVEIPAKLRNRYCTVDDRVKRVIDAFEEAKRFSRYHIGACPNFSDKVLLAAFKDTYGVDVIWQSQEGNPTCLGAFTNSLNNYYQTCTRMNALTVIFELVRWSDHTNIYLAGADQLRAVLYQRIHAATRELAMFGGLLGGEHAKMATQILCHEMAYDPKGHTKFSAIQFLQPEGRVPGSWQAAPENALSADIKARYEAL
jgi:hypothetical protein